MTYRESICAGVKLIADDPRHVFVGYGLTHGRAMGTIPPDARIYETPVAESLMCGLAAGMAIRGALACVFIERGDFVWNAMDVLVNHVDKLTALSRREIKCGLIVRIVVGNRIKPLFTGPTHTVNPYEVLVAALPNSSVFTVNMALPERNVDLYRHAIDFANSGRPTVLLELKDNL